MAFWADELAGHFRSLAAPPGTGVLVQSLEDPDVASSFGTWRAIEDVAAMREDPRSQELFDRARELCVEMRPGAYRLVATA